MRNPGRWAGAEYFVWYNTNFTSTQHHPSWYANMAFSPGEPGLAKAEIYQWP
jgi:hypothetical protein